MKKYVYFLRPRGLEGPVKIGCSDKPAKRLEALMTWAPVPLEIAATTPGDLLLERRIHHKFRESRSHMEWFFASRELTEFIAAVSRGDDIASLIDLTIAPLAISRSQSRPAASADVRKLKAHRQIKEARIKLGESQAVFGDRFGVHQSTIHRWETESPPQGNPAAKLLHQFFSEDRELPPPSNA